MTPKQLRLVTAYRATDYRILDGREWFSVRVGAPNPELDHFLGRENAEQAAFITAWNPGSKPRSDMENRAAGSRLAAHLRDQKLRFVPQRAVPDSDVWDPEDGHCVLGLGVEAALIIAEKFGQNAILVMRRAASPELSFTRLMQAV